MDADTRKYYLNEIKRYAEKVNGFPPKPVSIDYWKYLNNETLIVVYYKWKELSELDDKEKEGF